MSTVAQGCFNAQNICADSIVLVVSKGRSDIFVPVGLDTYIISCFLYVDYYSFLKWILSFSFIAE